MRRPAPVPPSSSTADECEQQFYEAMQLGDIDRLMALWADDDEIACVHPGGQRLIGPEAIRQSFAAMFRQGGIDARVDRVRRLQFAQTAIHHVVERIQAPRSEGPRFALITVTNAYVQGPLGWRIALHHASPQSARVVVEGGPGGRPGSRSRGSDADDDAPTTLH